ncbi:MAG: sigma 54-interacting transcriptional regulator [Paenibacillaceae bacterium]
MNTMHWKADGLDLLHAGVVFFDSELQITKANRYAIEMLGLPIHELIYRKWKELFPGTLEGEPKEHFEGLKNFEFVSGGVRYIAQIHPITAKHNHQGAVMLFQSDRSFEEIMQQLDSYKYLSSDLQAIFDISYDVIYVSDGEGKTLRVSAASEKLWGYKESELLGKSVSQLEKEGVFKPSVTRMVLEKRTKVSTIQTTKTGRRLMVVGTPIMNEEGNIVRVVNASRDITEISRLQNELEEMKQVTEGYKKELMDLRKINEENRKIVFQSEKMRQILTLAQKIAGVDSTVLIQGKSGVGKEVIASAIHNWSSRKEKPYIIVNCGSLPEALLEQELFGGIHGGQASKMGSLELANEGTLFLDEIAEMPLSIQAKLIRVLQDQEFTRKGADMPVKVNIRFIASTAKDLKSEMTAGRFREDLYYRLHVIPIVIPPLQERVEDILPLTLYLVDLINKKYNMSKQFASKVVEFFQKYQWPGNVRELQNVIERLMVTTDESIIGTKHLPDYIIHASHERRDVEVNKIIPLKEAMVQVEKQLLELARSKYGSTTRIAKALGVNQSTISRKLQQYEEQ